MPMNDIHCLKNDYKGDVIHNESIGFSISSCLSSLWCPCTTQGDWCNACIAEVLHVSHVPPKFLHSLDSAWILADYRGGIKSMIYDVKFNEKKEQSKGAAPFLASYNFYMKYNKSNIVNSNCKIMYDYIVPVPSSEKEKS